MREPKRTEKHLILALLILGCLIVDAGFILGLGAALKWLAETSPFVLAALTAVVIVAVRVFLSLRRWTPMACAALPSHPAFRNALRLR